MLGRGKYADDISEMSGIPVSSVYRFFHAFVDKFSSFYYDSFVKFPSGDELAAVNALYAKIGLPGTCGSIDCTHLRWDRCPNVNRNNYIGKEGFPSIAYEVIVDHNRYIL